MTNALPAGERRSPYSISLRLVPIHLCVFILLGMAGCQGITEYDGLWSHRVDVLSLPEMEPLGHVEGIEDGVDLLPVGGPAFLVSGLGGEVYYCSAAELQVIDTWELSDPASGGCGQMMMHPWGQDFYVVTGNGRITQASLSGGGTVDQLEVATSPSSMSLSVEPEYMFVSDAATGWLYEVWCPANEPRRSTECAQGAVAMAPLNLDPGYMIMACPDSRGTIYWMNLDFFYPVSHRLGAPCSDLAVTGDSTYAIAHPRWGWSRGIVTLARNVELNLQSDTLEPGGHPHRLCCDRESAMLYIGSRLEGGSTLISAYSLWESEIVAETEVSGFLQEMALSSEGQRLLLLMYE